MQDVYTHNNGNKCRCRCRCSRKITFIQNITMYWDHAKPIRSFARLVKFRLGEFIPEKGGRLIELDNKEFMTSDTWCAQFCPFFFFLKKEKTKAIYYMLK